MSIAVIGCGSIGLRHLRNLQSIGCEELLVFDTDARALKTVENELGIKAADSMDDVWAMKPIIAVINTPTQLHTEVALDAAKQGCHIFVEKPVSHKMDRIDELSYLLKAGGLLSMVGCNMRFHPGPVQIKKWLDEGIAGQAISARIHTGSYLPGWRPGQDHRKSYSASVDWGGAILDCIHEIDLATWLLGEAEVLSATTLPAAAIGIEAEGLAEILLRHEGGAISSVHLNYIQRNYDRGIQIIGTEGTLVWSFNGNTGYVRLFGPEGKLENELQQPLGWKMNDMYLDEMRYFTSCVDDGRQTFNPIDSAASTLALALEARNHA